MKLNKWTVGLAAVGLVTLASTVKAEEKQNFLQTALSSTTISGYVDTSIEWTAAPQQEASLSFLGGIPFRSANKQDGFNLNVIKLTIEKPLDESQWASGYKIDLLAGPDATSYNASITPNSPSITYSGADVGIKQAYVALRAPIGNGVDFKIGTFDTVIGYEVFEAGNNPNFTRSWGYAVEPTQHTGILASYRVNDFVSFSAGVANTLNAGINARPMANSFSQAGTTTPAGGSEPKSYDNYWCKTWMGSVALTAPQSWGFLSGSTLYAGAVYGLNGGNSVGNNAPAQDNIYVGATLNTPVAGLKVGAAFDHVGNFGGLDNEVTVVGGYASYQATQKLSVHGRYEYVCVNPANQANGGDEAQSVTATVQYDLWQNVVSRLEARWDHTETVGSSAAFTSDFHSKGDYVSFYANIIYKF